MAQNRMVARLRVYAANGDVIGALPHPMSWEMSAPLNDMSSLTVVYPKQSPSIALLDGPCEVVVGVRDPATGTFAEYPNSRFLNLRRAHDMVGRPGTVSYTMPSYGWMLRKVRFTNKSLNNKEGRRVFTATNPGRVLKALIDEAKARGNVPGLTYSFTNTHDSAGVAWPDLFDGEYDYGQDAWSILDALTNQFYVDWRFQGRELQVYVPDTAMMRNKALDTDGVIIHPHTSTLEEPVERTWEDLAHTMIVKGDKNASQLVENNSAETPWGKWEEVLSAGGTLHPLSMINMGTKVLATKATSRLQITRQISWREGMPTPFVDYRVGDIIRARTENGVQVDPQRVHQITLSTIEPYGMVAHLTMNDRFLERGLKTERWMNRISGTGGPGAGGGTGATPLPVPQPDPENVKPAVPTGLAVTSTGYFTATGEAKARARVEFDPVFEDVDGNDMDIGRYIFYGRPASIVNDLSINGTIQHPLNATPGNKLVGYLDNLDAGEDYRFAVQAVGLRGRVGDFSSEVSAMMAYPTTPMPVPSEPVLSTRLGTVKVEWDGNDENGAAMPTRFREIRAEMSLSASGPWSQIGEIFQPGSAIIVTGQDSQLTWGIGDTLYFRFNSVDSAHNVSVASDVASIVVVGVEGPDIEANSITANHITAGSITAEKIKAYSLTVDRLSVGEPNNMIADPAFSNTTLNATRVATSNQSSSTWLPWSISGAVASTTKTTGSPTGDHFGRFFLGNNTLFSPQIQFDNSGQGAVGKITQLTRNNGQNVGGIMTRMRATTSGPAFPGGAQISVNMAVKFFDRADTQIGNFIFATSVITATGSNVVVANIPPGLIPLVNTVGAYFYAYTVWTNVPDGVTLSLSEFSAWQENSVYIGNGMISAPLIAADAITTTQLKADAINVKHTITGAVFQTSVPGSGTPRVQISPNANYLNQAGVVLDSTGPGARDANIFIADGAGTGGWDPYSFGIVGPEATRNSSGRADISLKVGGGLYLLKAFVDNASRFAGVQSPTGSGELGIVGYMPRGDVIGDGYNVFRTVNIATASSLRQGTFTWGLNIGWTYRPLLSPNAISTTVPMYANYYTLSAASFSWRQSDGSDSVQVLAFRGSYEA